jgi:hypothetical protein
MLAALVVFTCGWLAMKTDDWRQIIGYAVVALGASALAASFSRRTR